MEDRLLANLDGVNFRRDPLMLFDDIRVLGCLPDVARAQAAEAGPHLVRALERDRAGGLAVASARRAALT